MVNTKSGFSLVELLVTVLAVSILAAFLFPSVINIFAGGTRGYNKASLNIEAQTTLRNIVEQVRNGSSLRDDNQITDPSNASGWSTDSTANVLVVAVPAVDGSSDFINNDLTGLPYQNEFVYFSDANNNFYRRTLANPAASGNSRTTTCPAATASPSCPADALLSDNFFNLEFELYNLDNQVTAIPNQARSIDLTLQLSQDGLGKDVVVTNSNQMTFRNIGEGNVAP